MNQETYEMYQERQPVMMDEQEEYNEYLDQLVNAPQSAMCDLCGAEEYLPIGLLKARGWFLANGMELCNRHD